MSQDSLDVACIQNVLRYTYINEYDSAEQSIQNYEKLRKSSLSQIYRHFLTQVKFKDFEILEEERSDSLIQAIEESIKNLENLEKSPWQLYLLGSSYFIKAAEEQRQKNSYTALQDGYSAIDFLEEVIKDKRFGDAKLGIGTFKYWKSIHTKYIPFFSDEREEGIQLINDAKNQLLSSDLAIDQQRIYVLVEEKKLKEALTLSKKWSNRFPQARIFLWAKAHVLYKLKRYAEAYKIYEKLFLFYRNKSRYNEMELQRKMALCLQKQGHYLNALAHIQIAKRFPSDDIPRLMNKADEILDLEDELTDLMTND